MSLSWKACEKLWSKKTKWKKKNYELKEKPRSEKSHRNSCHELNYYYFQLSFPFQILKLFDLISEICKFSTCVPSRLFFLLNILFSVVSSWTPATFKRNNVSWYYQQLYQAYDTTLWRKTPGRYSSWLLSFYVDVLMKWIELDEISVAQFTSISFHQSAL